MPDYSPLIVFSFMISPNKKTACLFGQAVRKAVSCMIYLITPGLI